MDKQKNNSMKLLLPKDYIYLVVIFLMTLIFGFDNVLMIIIGLSIFAIVLFVAIKMNKAKNQEIEKHIESLAFNFDRESNALSTFPLPMVTIELNGMIFWSNSLFRDIVNTDTLLEKYITEFIPEINLEELVQEEKIVPFNTKIGDRFYSVMGNLMNIKTKNRKEQYVITLYFIDNTEYTNLLQLHYDEKPCMGVVIIDNYDELMQSIEDTKRPQLLAEIDQKLNEWYGFSEGILKKYERDKYIAFFKNKYLSEMEEDKFEVLDLVKNIDIGNKLPVTVSIGISAQNETFSEGLKNALSAIEVALGRGGDQVVINNQNQYTFFGGNSKEVEKRTRVKARVMANALEKLIEQSENVIIMGHSNPDADAIGAAVGLYRVAQCMNREANIVVEDKDNISIREMMKHIDISGQYANVFVNHNEALNKMKNDTLLIVVDTHRSSFTELPELLKFTKKIVVIDHHRKVTDSIPDAILTYHEIYASSASELVTELLQYMDKKVVIRQIEAESLYAGIIVDTKNFTLKTGIRTFEAAAFLKKYGVDTMAVKQMFQNDIDIYVAKAEVIKNAEIIDDEIAISICDSEENGALIAAQSADELLNIVGIKASFVLSRQENQISISGRSLGEINVQLILEKLGGGGSMTIAGAQIIDSTEEEVIEKLKQAIKEYKETK
ncbi:MAG: phosphoesterase [Clostridiales bacterium]|nr:phosphoesterase [Clostridiales bacterium]